VARCRGHRAEHEQEHHRQHPHGPKQTTPQGRRRGGCGRCGWPGQAQVSGPCRRASACPP
jgi:hypothetical protein